MLSVAASCLSFQAPAARVGAPALGAKMTAITPGDVGTTKPLGVLVALQDETRLDTPQGVIAMEQGDVLVFDGDVVHAGAAYAQDNTRVHLYLDATEVPRVHNVTYLTG